MMNLSNELGWTGSFTRDSYPGAIANGTIIEKAISDPGDGHPVGTMGRVLGSISHPDMSDIGYFVEWATDLKKAVFVTGRKIKASP